MIVLAEASIETVPEDIKNHPAVLKHAARKQKRVDEILLDRSYHHRAMLKLKEQEKRGRPDIVYHVLLDVTGSPLYRKGKLRFIIHTINNEVIILKEFLRPPRAYFRFEGLFEQLFRERIIRDREGNWLIKIVRGDMKFLMDYVKPDVVVGFSRLGKYKDLSEIVEEVSHCYRPMFVIGGFPKGHFREETSMFFNRLYSISKMGLDASLVVSRLIYELEKVMKIQI